MKQIFGILTLLFYGIFTAQTINGKIISRENNEPIPYARIGIENENFGAIADENGNYSIDLTFLILSEQFDSIKIYSFFLLEVLTITKIAFIFAPPILI